MNLKVLLVDDDESLRDIIKDILEMHDYTVVTAVDGLDALTKFESDNFNLIITDLMMDRLNGIDFIKKLKTKYENVPPIILMTGYGSVESAVEAFKLGVKDYIIKPFKVSLLLSIIDRVLKQASLEKENIHLKEIVSLYSASEKINNSIFLNEIGKTFVESIREITKGSIVVLYLKDQEHNTLKTQENFFEVAPKFINGKEKIFNMFKIKIPLEAAIDMFNKSNNFYIIKKKNPFIESLKDVSQTVIIQLKTASNLIGLLFIISLDFNFQLPEEKIKALKILIDESSIALENALLFQQQEEMFFQTLNSLALTIDAKDKYTHGHSLKVSKYSEIIAKNLGLNEKVTMTIVEGALIHDIGKIGIPDGILLKPGKLTDYEYKIIKTHPVIGKNILEPLKKNFGKIIDITYYHHERYDGNGYPEGLKGEEIPLEVRIVAVADSFDAMTSDRAYRKGMSIKEGVKELIKNKGRQFDPQIVDCFITDISEIEKIYYSRPEDLVSKF